MKEDFKAGDRVVVVDGGSGIGYGERGTVCEEQSRLKDEDLLYVKMDGGTTSYYFPHRFEKENFKTGDRVVSVVNTATLQVGMKGTVNSVSHASVSLIMDHDGEVHGYFKDKFKKLEEDMEVDLLAALGGKPKEAPLAPKVMSALDKAIAHGSPLHEAITSAGGTKASRVKGAKAPTEPKIELVTEPIVKPVAPEGFFFLSEMTDGRLPRSGKDHLFKRYPDDHWDEVHRANIPKINKFYIWDGDVAEALWLGITLGERVLLHGLPGTGKTTAIKQLAAWVNQPYAKFGGKSGIEPSSFLGQIMAESQIIDGTPLSVMVWKDGLMPPAVRHGYMTTIDEFNKLCPEVQMAMQSLYEKGGSLMLDDMPGSIEEKTIIPAPEFNLFVTDNTLGLGDNMHLFAASQMQDTSTLDRFSITCPVVYLGEDEEVYMLEMMHTSCAEKSIRKLVKFANLVRESYRTSDLPVTLSPRGLDAMCGMLGVGIPERTAIALVFTNKLAEDNHKILAAEQMRTVL